MQWVTAWPHKLLFPSLTHSHGGSTISSIMEYILEHRKQDLKTAEQSSVFWLVGIVTFYIYKVPMHSFLCDPCPRSVVFKTKACRYWLTSSLSQILPISLLMMRHISSSPLPWWWVNKKMEKRQAINARVSQSFVSHFLNSSKVHCVFTYNLGTLKTTSIPFTKVLVKDQFSL